MNIDYDVDGLNNIDDEGDDVNIEEVFVITIFIMKMVMTNHVDGGKDDESDEAFDVGHEVQLNDNDKVNDNGYDHDDKSI